MYCLQLSVLYALAFGPPSSSHAAPPLAPNWTDMHTKHRWNAVPGNWGSIGQPPVGTTIDLRIALTPHHEGALIDTLYKVSNPIHPRYGAYLSKGQVAELVAPDPDTLKLVGLWLEFHGVPPSDVSTSHGGSWLTVTGVPVSKANSLLGASYQLYQHPGTNETIVRTVGYALPAVLHGLVRTVAPTTFFGLPDTIRQTSRKHPRGAALSYPKPITPSHLRWLYKTEGYTIAAADKNLLAITGFHGEYASNDDLTAFLRRYRTDAKGPTFDVEEINNGGYNFENPGEEANTDMQLAQAMAWPTPHVFYSIGGLPEFIPDSFQPVNNNEPYLDWLNYMAELPSVPQTISSSYSGDEQTFPPDYAMSVCELFGQLGTRGVSILFSSGNNGVGGGDCKKNDGSDVVQFQPTFPPTCPYVTSVGGTTGRYVEVAASISSGGFSNVFERPKYQADALSTYFRRLGDKYAGLYNESSRGYPDISAQALNIAMIYKNELHNVDGTSCSVPITAGIISLLNDHRLSEKKPPLGFLNPWLYSGALEGLNDITSGKNPGCGTPGFSAIAGWDPITGLGTLDFKELLGLLPPSEAGTSEADTSEAGISDPRTDLTKKLLHLDHPMQVSKPTLAKIITKSVVVLHAPACGHHGTA